MGAIVFRHHIFQGPDRGWEADAHGQSSQHTGWPSPVKTAPTLIWRRSGRWSLEQPNCPRLSPPWPSKYRLVVSKKARVHSVNRSRRRC